MLNYVYQLLVITTITYNWSCDPFLSLCEVILSAVCMDLWRYSTISVFIAEYHSYSFLISSTYLYLFICFCCCNIWFWCDHSSTHNALLIPNRSRGFNILHMHLLLWFFFIACLSIKMRLLNIERLTSVGQWQVETYGQIKQSVVLFLNPLCRFYSYKGNSNNDNYEPEITV